MTITNQDYINMIILLLMYFATGWILIGISALTVKYFDPLNKATKHIQTVTAEQDKTRRAA